MIHTVGPRQNRHFDPFQDLLPPAGRKLIGDGWQGLFRHVLLQVMPADERADHFSDGLGAPTKELDAMAGLVFLADDCGWNAQEAAEAYIFRTDVQYALNLEPGVEISARTIERYQKLFREHDLAARVFEAVTKCLVRELDLDVARQRLDSTHVFSHMATFGRTKLLAVAIQRFLTQLQRHEAPAYADLPEELRQLEHGARLPAELLVDTSYASDENVQAAAERGVDLVGPVPGRPVETAAPAERGAEAEVEPLSVDDFGWDERSGAVGVCPAGPRPTSSFYDAATATRRLEMPGSAWAACPFRPQCPIKQTRDGKFTLEFTDKERRLAGRRVETRTPTFAQRYAPRAGIESPHSGLKNRLGLGRLPVRGRGNVFRLLWHKVAGWNVLRAAASERLRARVRVQVAETLKGSGSGPRTGCCALMFRLWARLPMVTWSSHSGSPGLGTLHAA